MTAKKRRGWFRWWFIPLLIILAFVIAIAAGGLNTTKKAATPKPGIAVVGERVEKGGIALTVLSVATTTDIKGLLVPLLDHFLVIEVLIETTTRDSAPYNYLYFKLKDDTGAETPVAMTAPAPNLSSGDLVQGDKVRGNIAFDVASSAKGFVLTYEPLVIMGGYEPIRVDLGR